MAKSEGKKRPRNNDQKGKGGANKKVKSKANKNNGRRPKRVASIVFDAEARTKYLQGFSQRKTERRAFGLAMQKVKDRKAKLEHRAELKSAEREQIQEAEQRKQQLLQQSILLDLPLPRDDLLANHSSLLPKEDDNDDNSQNNDDDDDDKSETTNIETYQDEQTQQQWGGTVIVTTSTHIPGQDEPDDDHNRQQQQQTKKPRAHDAAQEYAGHVERFLKDLKGRMPSKKKKQQEHKQRGGKHGASHMKGVGSAADLKTAQKMLARSTTAKQPPHKGGGKKRKR